jgi:hypothetical protein
VISFQARDFVMHHILVTLRRLSIFVYVAGVAVVSAQSGPPAVNQLRNDLVSSWVVTVTNEPQQRGLNIRGISEGPSGTFPLDATFGLLNGKLVPIRAEFTQSDQERRLDLVTQTDAKIIAKQASDGSFAGTIEYKNGITKPVKMERVATVVAATSNSTTALANGARPTQTTGPAIHMIVMGGNDCPPCVVWRALELPKLQQSEIFKSIRFSYVKKTVESPVPSSMFLPDEVKPYKAKLDEAGSGRRGSPQAAIMVNGEVYDYYFGTRSAKEVEQMIVAINGGGTYPYARCLKRNILAQCVTPA